MDGFDFGQGGSSCAMKTGRVAPILHELSREMGYDCIALGMNHDEAARLCCLLHHGKQLLVMKAKPVIGRKKLDGGVAGGNEIGQLPLNQLIRCRLYGGMDGEVDVRLPLKSTRQPFLYANKKTRILADPGFV